MEAEAKPVPPGEPRTAPIPGCLVQQIGLRHHPEYLRLLVCDREHLDAVGSKKLEGLSDRRVGRNGHHVACHDHGARRLARTPTIGSQLGLAQDGFEIVAIDVEKLVPFLQHGIEVFGAKAGARGRPAFVRVPIDGRADGSVRVGAPREVVEQQSGAEQQQTVGADRPPYETIAEVRDGVAAKHGRQGDGAARRMDAA